VRYLGLTDLGEIMILDVHPVLQIGPHVRQNVFGLPVSLRQLEIEKRRVNVLRDFDAHVVAVECLADGATQAVDPRQGISSEEQNQHQQ
jgi:hypothetical protein